MSNTEPELTLLVVDDDADLRVALATTLSSEGYRVMSAADGQEAIQLLTSSDAPEPAAIILDLAMPVMSGWDFLTVVRSYHRLARIPIVVMSAHARDPAAETLFGISAWLTKPQAPEQLLAILEKLRAQ